MCGVAALVRPDGLTPEDEARIRRMTDTMHHRGPDSSGFAISPQAALGIRRLRILDLVTGDQPIYSEDKNTVVVHNGEIYNYKDLSSRLESSGHSFSTKTDTEVIVHGYEEWGLDCVKQMQGMYAFALLDTKSSSPRLFLSRDRLGVKPLYYYQGDSFTIFASEVRALLASGLVPKRLSKAGLYTYLSFGSVQEPLTLIEGVKSVPPAHNLTLDLASGVMELSRYWDFPPSQNAFAPGSKTEHGGTTREFQAIVKELQPILMKAVTSRMIADVPMGAFLSGGIDSGTVVSLMAKEASSPVNAFTLEFGEKGFNEAPLARLVANVSGVQQTTTRLSAKEVLSDLPKVLESMDQPSVDGVNTYYVSKVASMGGMTVALSGVGGDELFAGYSTFKDVPALQKLQKYINLLPHLIRAGLAAVWSAIPWSFSRAGMRTKLKAFLLGDMLLGHPYFLARALFTPNQVKNLLGETDPELESEKMSWLKRVEATLERAKGYDPITGVSFLECNHYLLNTLLRDTDQMSMAHSLEVRVPLIDHQLVEYLIKTQGGHKLSKKDNTPKRLLVAALKEGLPDEIVHRPKATFTMPWEMWLKDSLRLEVGTTLCAENTPLNEFLDKEAVARVWRDFEQNKVSWSKPWSLYVLAKWLERHLK